MNRIALALALAVSLGASSHAYAASPHQSHHLRQVPVVATWFSNLHPAAGQQEVLEVQFVEGTRGLAGGRLSATIDDGRHTMHLKGDITNARGIASVSFTIPTDSKGTMLKAFSVVLFKGVRYRGSNQVRVAPARSHS